jgi:tRNA-uridine 2-sulfurtransferase
MKANKRVVVGLSGGVDSSVAAHLLIEQGYEVIGIFMRNWHDDSVIIGDECPWVEDSTDAMMVANELGIPFHTLDFSDVYKERIVDYMFAEYEAGRTPNPDVLCNREIKFDVFLDAAEKLGAEYVATGHYVRKGELQVGDIKTYRLLAGVDNKKDQSYFLCQLRQSQLARALFPLGELCKDEVRDIARMLGLTTAEKKDSQGLCFIGKVRLPEFLQQQLKPKSGVIIRIAPETALKARKGALEMPDISEKSHPPETLLNDICTTPFYKPQDGKVVGHHQGAHYYTIGQRRGLNVGGTAEPLYVIATDTHRNIIYVGMGDEHPGLYRNGLFVDTQDIHWIREDLKLMAGQSAKYLVRIRYRQPLFPASLIMRANGLYILFDEAQKGVAPGQFAAWYQADECIGSGVINGK